MLLLPGAITAWPFAARAAKGESSMRATEA